MWPENSSQAAHKTADKADAFIEISTFATLVALHSLEGFEEPHPHRFDYEVTLRGKRTKGKVLDFIRFERALVEYLKPMQGVYLNECKYLGDDARNFPTCENLACDFADFFNKHHLRALKDHDPSVELASVSVTLRSPEGQVFGRGRVGFV